MNAIGLLELKSIAKGIEACDYMLKVSNVALYAAKQICPGKFLIVIGGDVGAVQASMSAGEMAAAEEAIDSLIIPSIHEQVFPAITQTTSFDSMEAVGVIETMTVAASVIAADAAVKAANITLVSVMLASGLGGKAFVTLTGEVGAVHAAVAAAKEELYDKGTIIQTVVIPNPHERLKDVLV